MGSSTASETTINTSTDSANTMLTMVTTTDGEQPDDSFDSMDVPSETSPPASCGVASSLLAAATASSDSSVISVPAALSSSHLDDPTEVRAETTDDRPKCAASARLPVPRTSSVVPASGIVATAAATGRDSDADNATSIVTVSAGTDLCAGIGIVADTVTATVATAAAATAAAAAAVTVTVTATMAVCVPGLSQENRQGFGGGAGRTPTLPDLRATDYFSTPVRGSVDAGQPGSDLSESILTLIVGKDRGSSPSGVTHRPEYTIDRAKPDSGEGRHTGQRRKPSVNVTTNPLDISLIGAPTEDERSYDVRSSSSSSGSGNGNGNGNGNVNVNANGNGNGNGNGNANGNGNGNGNVNGTVNGKGNGGNGKPRGRPAGGNAGSGKRSTQAATIVVQQPSLSLDAPAGAATILLHPSEVDVRRREENMRHLLDVANTFTLQEIHDFEMRYGSPHHSRSQSVKTPGSRSSGRPNYLCLPQQRSRVASMPNTGVEEEYYRLRHFSIIGKGVVNRGDSLKSRRSRSNNSVASSNSSTEHLTASYPGSARNSAAGSLASSRESSASQGPAPYQVLMLGASAVGKSSLVSQFMTSEYLHAYDTSIDDESGEKTVSVLLEGEESELTFVDHTCAEMTPDTCIATYKPHAYCVVYSTTDRASVRVAEEVLQALWRSDHVSARAVILVGNKVDLVRSRLVSTEEGKSMATSYDCKFIETSVGINHNVDELLVGLLTQIRLKLENPERTRDLFRKRSRKNRSKSPLGSCSENNSPKKYRGSRTSTSLKVRNLLGKVWARDSKSKSCENLHVL